mmetsp:Transcript_56870/g.133345  ORF Transcript_56870/g.133345 Transcript_56870/m.133345 type:complete len:90 (+) Transcript_56870:761-1030(+)
MGEIEGEQEKEAEEAERDKERVSQEESWSRSSSKDLFVEREDDDEAEDLRSESFCFSAIQGPDAAGGGICPSAHITFVMLDERIIVAIL